METILWILVGCFIGWNVPEPLWAFNIKNNIKKYLNKEE